MVEGISGKLFEIRKRLGPVVKNATASGGKFSWDYVDMATLQDLLDPFWEEFNILPMFHMEGDQCVVSLTDLDSGQTVKSSITMEISEDYQSVGKQITYMERVQLLALLGRQPVKDTDGGDDPKCKQASATSFKTKSFNRRVK